MMSLSSNGWVDVRHTIGELGTFNTVTVPTIHLPAEMEKSSYTANADAPNCSEIK